MLTVEERGQAIQSFVQRHICGPNNLWENAKSQVSDLD